MSCSAQRIKVVDSLFICYLEWRLMVVSDWQILLKQSIDHGNAVRSKMLVSRSMSYFATRRSQLIT